MSVPPMNRLNEWLHQIVLWIEHVAESWGAPGLAAIAFVDSSFFTLPEVADFLVVIYTIREPDQWLFFAAMTTVGSAAGCYVLFLLGRKGGEALVRRGFHERHVDRVLDWFRRHGALVMIIPAILPPPMPLKLFVLLAGVSGLRSTPFIIAVVVGRGFRYGGEAWLARKYGERAAHFLQERAAGFVWPTVAILVVAGCVWWAWRRFGRPAPSSGTGADVE
ncbi:MAG TPA: VTT domain-containing protein [Vicinamibacterales bacterium]|nr:VTT domain-containing protein [Vicinamibacterales bacterium]